MKSTIFFVLLLAGIGISPDRNNRISGDDSNPVASDGQADKDINGPTVLLGYSKEEFKNNPISSFMYFIPLLSPTLVDRYTSVDNEQQVGIISYERKTTSKSFYVFCDFEILGKGFHKNTYDSDGMIGTHTEELKKNESLTNMLDYIKFEGEGFGRVEVSGIMTDSTPTVTEVAFRFNARGCKSPAIFGFYDIKPEDGQYKYENRSNQRVARVSELIFKKTDKTPLMEVKLVSISKTEESDGFIDGLKGKIANLFINPTIVDKLGNQAMLDFGLALFKQTPSFRFPKAKNIKEDRLVKIDSKQN
jgi:hypothetical protein